MKQKAIYPTIETTNSKGNNVKMYNHTIDTTSQRRREKNKTAQLARKTIECIIYLLNSTWPNVNKKYKKRKPKRKEKKKLTT